MSGCVIDNSAAGVIVRNNPGTSTTGQVPGALLNIPPNAPLDMGSLAVLFSSADAQSTPPLTVQEGDIYLDDGTNTKSETPGFRRYNNGQWEDLGLQEAQNAAIDGGSFI